MTFINKTVTVTAPITVKSADSEDADIVIEGYANTTDKDRHGDIVLEEAWKQGGLDNFLANPIVLAFHDRKQPIGLVTDHTVNSKGLQVTAVISKAAGNVYELVKAGILRTFSVGFRVKDAVYDSITDIFVIKDLELLEISVVSIPANSNAVFSLKKAFSSEEELETFKKQFTEGAKEPEQVAKVDNVNEEPKVGDLMDKQELEALLKGVAETAAETAAKAAATATKGLLEVGQSGAEKLNEDITKRLADEKASLEAVIAELRGEIKENKEALGSLQKNKMHFSDRSPAGESISYKEKEQAVLLAKAMGRDLTDTSLGKQLIEKAGAHVASAEWENIVSTQLQEEIRRRLVIAPLFRSIPMPTPTLMLPVNPEAAYGSWVTTAQYGTTASSGAAAIHQLKEITLTSYKLATKEFIANEEEEDAILALMPIIRDAVVRRTSKSVDKALLRGAASGSDPLKGLTQYETSTSNVTVTTTGAASVANLRTLRKNLGTWGLQPSDLVFVVSNDVYYDLLDDTNFLTMDKVGDRATLLTGQIGSVGGTPVILSGEFAAKAGGTAGSIGAVCVNVNNFMVGNHRGLRMESDYLVEAQSRILVASLRMAFQQVTTVDGHGVSCLRWT